jgi:hypothetical protein
MVRIAEHRHGRDWSALTLTGNPVGMSCLTPGCGRRVTKSGEWIAAHAADVRELLDLRLKCSGCDGRDVVLYLLDSPAEVDTYLHGGPYG